MYRYLALFVFAVVALAEERPLPNPEILTWQAEAQARERALNQRVEQQLEKARTENSATDREKPKSQPPEDRR